MISIEDIEDSEDQSSSDSPESSTFEVPKRSISLPNIATILRENVLERMRGAVKRTNINSNHVSKLQHLSEMSASVLLS